MKIEVIHKENDLNRKVWTFYFGVDHRTMFILDKYEEQTRRTKGCKWLTGDCYSRFNKRNSNRSEETVLTKEILEEARTMLLKMVDEAVSPILEATKKSLPV
jgi:hypothetical protein